MRRALPTSTLFVPTLAVLALALSAPDAGAVRPAPDARQRVHRVPGELIVRWRADADVVARDAQLVRLGASIERVSGSRGAMVIRVGRDGDVRQALRRLAASGLVEAVAPRALRYRHEACVASGTMTCPNDPLLGTQYGLHDSALDPNSGFNRDGDMDLPEAWAAFASPNANGVVIAVADDGFRLSHDDFRASPGASPSDFIAGTNCQPSGGCSGSAAAQSSAEDHGTAVAGSAAARSNNGVGIASPAFDGTLLPIRLGLTPQGGFSDESLLNAYDYVLSNPVAGSPPDILNLSLGGPVASSLDENALSDIGVNGVLVVASAGNSDSNTDLGVSAYPANYALENIVAVAASDSAGRIASFSQWGPTTVDVAAPGFQIRTSGADADDAYVSVSGTSFSAPYTAGVAALIGQRLIDLGYPNFSHVELRALLIAGAETSSQNGNLPLRGRVAAGRVNAKNSLDRAAELVNGTLGAVLVVGGWTVDDDVGLSVENDGDGVADAGETVDLTLTLRNQWQAAGAVAATLATTDANVTIDNNNDVSGAIGAFGTGTVTFRVTFSGTQNLRPLFSVALVPDTGAPQTRWFYFEYAPDLVNGELVTHPIGRNDWDEFQAWGVNVPAGATNVVFETFTNGGIDIDLLARRGERPEYEISLDVDPESGGASFWAGEEPTNPAYVSGAADGNELIGAPGTQAGHGGDITGAETGLWHLVVVNFDQVFASYRIRASWDAAGAGTVRFNAENLAVEESVGTLSLTVFRSGGVGAVSVDYATTAGSANAGTDFTAQSGTLSWAGGDMTSRTIVVPIIADMVDESTETFTVTLSNPTGGADLGRFRTYTVSVCGVGTDPIAGACVAPDGGGGGGGGATDAALLLALAALLARRRRGAR